MKVKVTIGLGMAIQNVDIDVPDNYILNHPSGKIPAITEFVNIAILRELKINWKELV